MTPPAPGAVVPSRTEAGSLAGAFLELTKPRIGAMVVLAALVGALLAAGPGYGLGGLAPLFEAALYVGLAAASSAVFNQVFERDVDGRMARTAARPLVTGRIRMRDGILFGAGLGAVAVVGLALRFHLLSALLALATIAGYALVYTPLKRVSTLNTVAGALPGAMPPLLGYAAVAGEVRGWGWILFAVLFAWQFPHFMAIAWMYRADYARAGLKMIASEPGARGMAGRQALLYSLALLPVSLVPAVQGAAGALYAGAALALGLAYAGASAAFALSETPRRARALLLVSLAYLPALFSAVLLDPQVRLSLIP